MIKIVADENIESSIIHHLRESGIDTISIRESNQGADDETVLQIANKQKAILVTYDTDFGELIYRLKKVNNGVILLRLSSIDLNENAQIIISTIKKHYKKMDGAFTVITKDKIRIRKL